MRYDDVWFGFPLPITLINSFYNSFEDTTDFLAVVGNVIVTRNRTYTAVRNDTSGIGWFIYDDGATYGSAERLQGIISFPIDSFFDLAEKAGIHEIGHRSMVYLMDFPLLAQGNGTLAHL